LKNYSRKFKKKLKFFLNLDTISNNIKSPYNVQHKIPQQTPQQCMETNRQHNLIRLKITFHYDSFITNSTPCHYCCVKAAMERRYLRKLPTVLHLKEKELLYEGRINIYVNA
jgi:hypothetical protein